MDPRDKPEDDKSGLLRLGPGYALVRVPG